MSHVLFYDLFLYLNQLSGPVGFERDRSVSVFVDLSKGIYKQLHLWFTGHSLLFAIKCMGSTQTFRFSAIKVD